MIKYISILLLLLSFSGCSNLYTPVEYPLRDGLIPKIDIRGKVNINNAQLSEDKALVYSFLGTTLTSDYKSITSAMVEQTKKELYKNFNLVSSTTQKDIDISVTYLLSTYRAMYWTSEIRFTVKLGKEKVIHKTVTHGSGLLIQDLNGCIAEAVIHLLNDHDVLAYLKK